MIHRTEAYTAHKIKYMVTEKSIKDLQARVVNTSNAVSPGSEMCMAR